MRPGYNEYSISTASAFLLYSTLVINVVILTSLSFDNPANENVLGDDFQSRKHLITLQTILLVFATIMFFNRYTSAAMILWKFWVFRATFVTLLLDMMSAIAVLLHLTLEKRIANFWKLKESTTIALPIIYIIIIAVSICYLVFKLHVAITLFKYGDYVLEGIWENQQLVSDCDIESNTPSEQVTSLPTPPPQYDQCVMEWEKPPPYSSLLVNCKT